MGKQQGFGCLPCPYCGEEGNVLLDLSDLDTFKCCECDREWSRSDLEEILAKWQRVLTWIDSAPKQEG